jgi:asparagine synthetase B (glutamine-hydrolysing)
MTIPFIPEFTIPRFLLEVRLGPGADIPPLAEDVPVLGMTSGPGGRCEIRSANVHPTPTVWETPDAWFVVLGRPMVGGKFDPKGAVAASWREARFDDTALRELNGEFLFLVFDKSRGRLHVVNDRYTAIPFYYLIRDGRLVGSPYFSDLWTAAGRLGERRLDRAGLLEFLFFQRVLGSKTYLRDGKFLPDAQVMEFDAEGVRLHPYWQRDYTKSRANLADHADRMAELVRQSIGRKTQDGRRWGHFLSGGMDSRTVLAGFERDFPTCFTATVGENRELRTARQIAETKGSPHLGLVLDEEHYGRIREAAVRISGGMYNYDHCLFLGFQAAVRERAEVCFHGYGFDYMFQGMYIPTQPLRLAGHGLYLQRMKPLPADLVGYYLDQVSYRIKGADVAAYLLPAERRACRETLQAGVEAVLARGKTLTENPHDLWEYLTFHHLSRHYSYPNIAGMAAMAEQRVVAFDNDLFALYLSLPVTHRFDGRIEKECLKRLDPRLAAIWSANTNLPVTASHWRQTLYQVVGGIKRRIVREPERPEWCERTWPSRDHALRQQETLQLAVRELLADDTLAMTGFLDLEKLRRDIPRWMDGEKVFGMSGDLVQTLLTLGTFLAQK